MSITSIIGAMSTFQVKYEDNNKAPDVTMVVKRLKLYKPLSGRALSRPAKHTQVA